MSECRTFDSKADGGSTRISKAEKPRRKLYLLPFQAVSLLAFQEITLCYAERVLRARAVFCFAAGRSPRGAAGGAAPSIAGGRSTRRGARERQPLRVYECRLEILDARERVHNGQHRLIQQRGLHSAVPRGRQRRKVRHGRFLGTRRRHRQCNANNGYPNNEVRRLGRCSGVAIRS